MNTIDTNAARDAFVTHYLVTLTWSTGDVPDDTELADGVRDELSAEARAWYDANATHIHCQGAPLARDFSGTDAERQAAMAGHDFALTRNGHGAGFWDGDWPKPAAAILTRASEAARQVDVYLGDDGLAYV